MAGVALTALGFRIAMLALYRFAEADELRGKYGITSLNQLNREFVYVVISLAVCNQRRLDPRAMSVAIENRASVGAPGEKHIGRSRQAGEEGKVPGFQRIVCKPLALGKSCMRLIAQSLQRVYPQQPGEFPAFLFAHCGEILRGACFQIPAFGCVLIQQPEKIIGGVRFHGLSLPPRRLQPLGGRGP